MFIGRTWIEGRKLIGMKPENEPLDVEKLGHAIQTRAWLRSFSVAEWHGESERSHTRALSRKNPTRKTTLLMFEYGELSAYINITIFS